LYTSVLPQAVSEGMVVWGENGAVNNTMASQMNSIWGCKAYIGICSEFLCQ